MRNEGMREWMYERDKAKDTRHERQMQDDR